MPKTVVLWLVGSMFLAGIPIGAAAQNDNGTLRVTVWDPQHALVSGAVVSATRDNTGVAAPGVTSSAGIYVFPNLLAGTYTVRIEARGFAVYAGQGIVVLASQTTEFTPTLMLGQITAEVSVRASANMAQAQSSQTSGAFEGRSISDIPIVAGANYSVLNLSIFLPNTTTATGGTSGTGGSFGGLRGRQNNFSIDGVDNNDPTTTTASQQVIPDAVQQFVVNQNVLNAEYGRGSGGQINVITKSGSNQFHTAAWLYNMNRAYNAADNQEHADIAKGVRTGKRRFDLNRVGGEAGGAVLPNRLFVYGAYEFSDINRQATAPSGLAPTSAGMTALSTLAVNPQVRDLLAQFPVAPTQRPCPGPPSCTVLVNGQSIPIGAVNSIAPDFARQHDFLINGDLHLNDQVLHVRYLQNRVRRPFLGVFPQEQFASSSAVNNWRLILNHTWTVTSRFANDFQTSFSRFSQQFPLSGMAATYPTLVISDLGSITIGPNTSIPQHRIFNEYLFGDAVSWTAGRHAVKFGGRYFWYVAPAEFLPGQRGQYTYGSLSQLVNDSVPSSGSQGLGSGYFSGNSNGIALFLQDDIKVTPHLTVNVGLRYDFFGNPADAKLNALNAVANLPGTPLVFNVPKSDRNNIGPRLGFAWDPTGSHKLAVRGGASVAYDWIPWGFYANGIPIQRQASPSIQVACLGTFGPAPAWCPTLSGFWANGAMNINFVPPGTAASARAQTGQMMSDARSPKVISWSLAVEREILRNTSVEVRYLATRALELPVQVQLNSITAFDRGGQPVPTYMRESDIPGTVSAAAPTLAQFSSLRALRYAAQGFTGGFVTTAESVGASTYHGGAVEFLHRFDRGWYLRTNYTYSKTMDDSTVDLGTSLVNPRRPQDSYNLLDEWARSALDVRHKVGITFLYDPPRVNWDQALARRVLNGWTLSGSYLFQSGQPITIQSGVDSNGNGDFDTDRVVLNSAGTEGVGSLVNRVCRDTTTGATSIDPTCPSQNTVGYVAADPNAKYIQAGAGAVTNSGRNTFDSPAFNTWNMALQKEDAVAERVHLRFRLEAYNVCNHPNFTIGNLSVFPSTNNAMTQGYASLTGVPAGTFLNSKIFNGGGRQLQLSLKVSY
jgi:outer membrane receptor protein involved in Fe transport